MKPANSSSENFFPVKIARFEQCAGFVATIVKDHRCADALVTVAIDSGHVGAVDAIMFEMFVEWFDAHRADALGGQVADRTIDHRGPDASLNLEAIGEVSGDIEFAATDVDVAMRGLAEGNDAGIEPMDQRRSEERRGGKE